MTEIADRNEAMRRLFGVAEPWLALRNAHPLAGVVVEISAEPRVCLLRDGDDEFHWRPALDDDDVPLLESVAPVVRVLLSDRDADEVTDLASGRHGPLTLAVHPMTGTALLLAGAVIVGIAVMQATEPLH
ncbi:MAG: hypothetical protein AMXMBFR78_04570 [Rubrivivax sp.]|jgi:hypothetical protein|nr:hypothetical protein [Rubrivivax sp.]